MMFVITDYSLPEIEARDLKDIWFQQDGRRYLHTAPEIMAFLREQLNEQLNSRFGPVNRAPRSCERVPVSLKFFFDLCFKALHTKCLKLFSSIEYKNLKCLKINCINVLTKFVSAKPAAS